LAPRDCRDRSDGREEHTPGDFDELGGCFHSYMANAAARQVWGDPDESIKSGAVRALLARFPEYRDRVVRVVRVDIVRAAMTPGA
jgi:hypothetical protein